MKEIKIFVAVVIFTVVSLLCTSLISKEHYGEVTERVCNNGVETVTVDTEIGRITDVLGDYPIGSRVIVEQNYWRATAKGIGE